MNRSIDPNARMALNQMKHEIASELGIESTINNLNGNINSRNIGTYAGKVGGQMTKKLIEIAEKGLIDK